jgi:membrane-bound lytic murein transglycosylase D
MKIKVGGFSLAVLLILCAGSVVFIFAGARKSDLSAAKDSVNVTSVESWSLPAEVSFAGEVMPLQNFDTRESLDRELNATAYRHASTLLTIKRASRYFPEIEKILKENNIPDDFKYLACAESDLANVISPMGATGFWQIMEGTGKEYGLTINKEIDDRYNLEKSTRFACSFFKRAYDKYGSWTMAAAAYNNGTNGLDDQLGIQKENNYYDLLLNEETSRYVFRITALKIIMSDPEAYGFRIKQKDLYMPVPYYEVTLDSTVVSFEQYAHSFNTNYKMLKLLNPWLRKPSLNNPTGIKYTIRIPEKDARTKID